MEGQCNFINLIKILVWVTEKYVKLFMMQKQIRSISVPPAPLRLIENLTQIGYSFHTAIADLIDNSIQANSSDIYIDMCSINEADQPYVIICDNGKGMNKERLIEAMRFGSKEKYIEKDLGKFGLGLKTASLSQCRILTVISKPRTQLESKSRLNICKWDINYVYSYNEWRILNPKESELEDYEKLILEIYKEKIDNGGTLVIWSDMKEFLPGLYDLDHNKRVRFVVDSTNKLKSHLGLTFHRFLDGTVSNKKRLKIFFDEKEIKSIDPFYTREKTKQMDKKEVYFDYGKEGHKKSKVIFSPYILPREDQFSSIEAYKNASKQGTWLSNQGFYFYRNGRLLKYGDWSSCATKDRKNILLRVAVDFNEKLDLSFEINISKEKATIPKKYKNEVSNFLKTWIQEARKRWYGKNKNKEIKPKITRKHYKPINIKDVIEVKAIKNGNKILCNRSPKDNKIIISVPTSNPLAVFLEKKTARGNKFKEFSISLLLLLEVVRSKKLKREHIPPLNKFEKFFTEESNG